MATRHDGVDVQGKWLAQVLRGWMAYYAVPMSGSAISAFRHHMAVLRHARTQCTGTKPSGSGRALGGGKAKV